MILLACGGRRWSDIAATNKALDMLPERPLIVIQGGCKGADLLAKYWATNQGIHSAQVDALWTFYDNKAGTIRNEAMLILKPTYCIAFPGGTGTQSMKDLCAAINIPVWIPYD